MDLAHPFNCLTFNLQRATRSLMRGFEAAAKESGLTAPQFTTLTIIASHGSASVTQVAERLGADRTTVTRNLEVMARNGWIHEEAAEDGRLHVWTLSPDGRAKLDAAMPVWAAYQSGLVDKIGAEGVRTILTTLARL